MYWIITLLVTTYAICSLGSKKTQQQPNGRVHVIKSSVE